jgi:hypothetical protein
LANSEIFGENIPRILPVASTSVTFMRFNKDGTIRIQGTFRELSGNIQGTFREHSGNIQGTFREHSGNIQGASSES